MPFFRTPGSASSLHITNEIPIVSIIDSADGHMKSTYLDEDNLRSIAAHLNKLLERDHDDMRERANSLHIRESDYMRDEDLDAIDLEDHEPEGYDDEPCITNLSTCVDNNNRIITTVVLDNGEILQHTEASMTRAWKKITPPKTIEP